MSKVQTIEGLSGAAFMDLVTEIVINSLLLAFTSRQGAAMPREEVDSHGARMGELAERLDRAFGDEPVLNALTMFLQAAPPIGAIAVQQKEGGLASEEERGATFDRVLRQRLRLLPSKTKAILGPVIEGLLQSMEAARAETTSLRSFDEELRALAGNPSEQEAPDEDLESQEPCNCPLCTARAGGPSLAEYFQEAVRAVTTPAARPRTEICWTEGTSGKVAVVDFGSIEKVPRTGFLVLDPSVHPVTFQEAVLKSQLDTTIAMIAEVPPPVAAVLGVLYRASTGEKTPEGTLLWIVAVPGKDLRLNTARMVEGLPGLRALALLESTADNVVAPSAAN